MCFKSVAGRDIVQLNWRKIIIKYIYLNTNINFRLKLWKNFKKVQIRVDLKAITKVKNRFLSI